MILEEIQKQLEKQKRGEFLYPLYESYCLSNIPSAVLYSLGLRKTSPLSGILDEAGIRPKKSRKVILLLVDAFGYNQWLRYAKQSGFLRRMTERAVVVPVTTVFPSETVPALTTMHSGLTPQEHGLPAWWVYLEELDKIISPFYFAPMGEKSRDTLLDAGVDPKILFTGKTIYQTLAASKIPSFTFINDAYAQSAYSKVARAGSETISFINSSDLVVNLRKKISEIPSPAYFYVYWDVLDHIAHTYGPHSEQSVTELNGFFHILRTEFLEKIDEHSAEEIVFMITADHGQISVDPKKTLYLNEYPEVVKNFRMGPSGNKILPWGSARAIFLAIKEEKLEESFRFLTKILGGKATVVKSKKALQEGLFGRGTVHKKFLGRIGNILILPHHNTMVWYEHLKGEKDDCLGMHGGLSADEMLVPFAAANLARLL